MEWVFARCVDLEEAGRGLYLLAFRAWRKENTVKLRKLLSTRSLIVSLFLVFTSIVAGNQTVNPQAASHYRLDASEKKFIAHALRGGLLWFKGHDHMVAVHDFTGEARLDPASLTNSSLQITAKTATMEETSSVFTDAQKRIINRELREIVLLPDRYPEIVFKSSGVTGKAIGNNQYDLKIAGDLTLHGITKPITIPAKVTITGNDLRAEGEFSI